MCLNQKTIVLKWALTWFWAAASLLDLTTEWAQYNTKLTLQIIKINIETGWTRLDDLVHAFVPRAGIDGDAGEKGESFSVLDQSRAMMTINGVFIISTEIY